MADKNVEIVNNVLGTKVKFHKLAEETNYEYIEYDIHMKPGHPVLPKHKHLIVEEKYQVVKGTAVVVQNKQKKEYKKGEVFVLRPGDVHTTWNSGKDELILRGVIKPALYFQEYYELSYKLAEEGKCNAIGVPKNPVRAACLMHKSDIYLPILPPVQKFLYFIYANIGKLFGYELLYSKTKK